MFYIFASASVRPPFTSLLRSISLFPHSFRRVDKQKQIQVRHLQEAAKLHHTELRALKEKVDLLQEERDNLREERDTDRRKLERFHRENGLLQDKMRLYSQEGGVDPSALEEALTLVKRRTERPADVDFLEKTRSDITSGILFRLFSRFFWVSFLLFGV